MALWSTSCRGERHIVWKGVERGRERGGEREGDGRRERKRTGNGKRGGRQEQGGHRGLEEKRLPLAGNTPGVLWGRGCRLDSELTISGTGAKGDWIQHSKECPRPTWTWASSRKPSARMESKPASRLGTASSLRTRQSDTAAEWPCSTGRHHFLRWKPCASLAPTLSASSWRRERGGVTSLDVTSPPTTP